jgi:hypothetical protein
MKSPLTAKQFAEALDGAGKAEALAAEVGNVRRCGYRESYRAGDLMPSFNGHLTQGM